MKSNIHSGRLAIDILGGTSNLGHRLRLHGDAVCRVHALLDDDAAGRNSFAAAKAEGLIDTDSVNFTTVGGKQEAELEDLYDENVFKDIIASESGLEWSQRGADDRKKWTERVRNLLRRAGKPLDSATLMAIKIKVAQAAASRGIDSLHTSKSGPVISLATTLARKLGAN